MNKFLRSFLMTAIKDMIKNNVVLYQTYQYASGWFSKGVLVQEDLEEIQRLYEEKEAEKNVQDENIEDIEQIEVIEENSSDTAEDFTETEENTNEEE